MTFKKQYRYLADEISQSLMQQIKTFPRHPEIIFDSMEHSLFAGGKRLRPVMLLAAHQMVNGDIIESMPLACGIEMIHTYSLIHDDLPAMDNDDFRRGMPTNHKVFGEGIAILAGDGLLNLAFEIMLENALNYPEKLRQHIEAINIIARAAGIRGMIGGQIVDLESEGKNADSETLEYIHQHKTGALFIASLMAGITLENPSKDLRDSVYEYGKCLGLAFQITDDILDVVGDSDKLGKKIGRDQQSKKATYVQLYGLERAKRIAEELIQEAIDSLQVFGNQAAFLQELAYFIIHRQS